MSTNPNNPPPQGFGTAYWQWVTDNILFIKRRQNAISGGGGGGSQDLQSVTENGATTTIGVAALDNPVASVNTSTSEYIQLNHSSGLVFATSGGFGNIAIPTLTDDRTYTLPDGSGTLALLSDIPPGLQFKGTWDADTNTPTLTNGVGTAGDFYICVVAGSTDFGAGPIAFLTGDMVVYTGDDVWENGGPVASFTLQQVTDTGNTTTNTMVVTGVAGETSLEAGTISLSDADSGNFINLTSGAGAGGVVSFGNGSFAIELTPISSPTEERIQSLQDANGTLALVETTDLQAVTAAGNTTNIDINVDDGGGLVSTISPTSIAVVEVGANAISIDSTSVTFSTNADATSLLLVPDTLTDVRQQTFQDADGVIALISDIPSPDVFELVANKVTDLSAPDDTTYPTTQAVSTAITGALAGFESAAAVQAATTTVLPNSPTYNNGASGVGATLTAGSNGALTIDGYSVQVNDRLLIKNQASTFQNGIYEVTEVGSVGTPYVLTRTTDYDEPAEINNTGSIPVINGTANALTSWISIASVTTIGTDPILYTQFTYMPSIIALNTQGLSQFPAGSTTSAQLRTVISDETGTGALVFSDDPLFPTQITVGVSGGAAGVIHYNTGSGEVLNLAAPDGLTSTFTIILPSTLPSVGQILSVTDVVGTEVSTEFSTIGATQAVDTVSGTTYTFVLTDAGKMKRSTSGSATTFTIPTNASVAFPVGTQIDLLQFGAGKLTIAAIGGVTLNSLGGNKSAAGQYVGMTLKQVATDSWVLMGNLIA